MIVPWLSLFRDTVRETRLRPLILSLATVGAEGRAHVRSVVCRRVGEDGSLWIASDSRSGKQAQLAARPEAEALCWIAATREQFRFAGEVEILGASTESSDRVQLWREMTPESRAMFSWPTPGRPRDVSDTAFARTSDAALPPNTFEILKLHPIQVEYLSLAVHPHRRVKWTRNQDWDVEDLNP